MVCMYILIKERNRQVILVYFGDCVSPLLHAYGDWYKSEITIHIVTQPVYTVLLICLAENKQWFACIYYSNTPRL